MRRAKGPKKRVVGTRVGNIESRNWGSKVVTDKMSVGNFLSFKMGLSVLFSAT